MEDIPVFPSSLPQVKPGFGVSFEGNQTRTQMESGRSRQRKRFSTDINTFSAEWNLSNFEYEVFKAFLKHKLNSATDWFYIDLFTGGELKTVKARVANGAYSATEIPVLYWDVSATLETFDDLSISERLLNFITETGLDPNQLKSQLIGMQEANDRYTRIINQELAYNITTANPWD